MLSADDVVACQGPEDQRLNSTQTAEEISEGVEWNDPPTSSPDKVSPPCRIGPEGMESNRLNEYLFQLWIQNQVWFLGPPTQRVMKQSPALKKGAPCPGARSRAGVKLPRHTLSVPLAPGRAEPERKEAG